MGPHSLAVRVIGSDGSSELTWIAGAFWVGGGGSGPGWE